MSLLDYPELRIAATADSCKVDLFSTNQKRQCFTNHAQQKDITTPTQP
jgi:hypothetical protein